MESGNFCLFNIYVHHSTRFLQNRGSLPMKMVHQWTWRADYNLFPHSPQIKTADFQQITSPSVPFHFHPFFKMCSVEFSWKQSMLYAAYIQCFSPKCIVFHFGDILKTLHGLYQWFQTAGPWSTSSPPPSVTQPDVKYIMEPLLWQPIICCLVTQLYQRYSLHAKS